MKEAINKMKRQSTEWKKILVSDISDKILISKIYEGFIQINIKNTNNMINNSQRT